MVSTSLERQLPRSTPMFLCAPSHLPHPESRSVYEGRGAAARSAARQGCHWVRLSLSIGLRRCEIKNPAYNPLIPCNPRCVGRAAGTGSGLGKRRLPEGEGRGAGAPIERGADVGRESRSRLSLGRSGLLQVRCRNLQQLLRFALTEKNFISFPDQSGQNFDQSLVC